MPICLVIATIAAIFSLSAAAEPKEAAGPTAVERTAGGDHFAAGGSLRFSTPVSGDLFAFAGNIDVDSTVGGDAVVAGGNVRIGAPVAQSVYAAGGQVVIITTIGRNARIAGGQVEIDRRAQIAGNMTVAGGHVKLEGRINGEVNAGGGSVVIDGPVGGDVAVTAGSVELGPDARIGGRLRYASRGELNRHAQAQVLGGVERLPFDEGGPRDEPQREVRRSVGWAWILGLLLIAAVLSAALPDPTRRVAETLLNRPLMSLLVGFVALVCLPVAAFVLLLTVIGAPLALLVVLLYLALLLTGYVGTGIAIGHWSLRRFAAARTTQRAATVIAAAAGMLVVALLGKLPWIGGFIVFAALVAGIGALALQFDRRQSST